MVNSNPDSESQQAGSQSPSDVVQPSMTMHPITYSGMPTMHMYPFPPGMVAAQPPRTKRRQVKNACTNCQKACKKCDDARPCLRCVKYGIAEECIDSQRKERQKGIKRGPYKKRDGKNRATSAVVDQSIDISVQSGIIPAAVAATSATPPIPYVAPMGYSPGFYGQYPAPPAAKPGEAPLYYPQFYIAPMPALPPTHAPGQEGEPTAYPAHQFFPTAFLAAPYAQPYPHPYMLPRPDGQIALAAPSPYAAYPQVYPKHVVPREANGDMPPAQVIDPTGRREMRLENGRMGEGLQQGAHGKST